MSEERKVENEIFAKNFNQYLSKWREETGKNLGDFASSVYVTRKTVWKWRNAICRPEKDQYEIICDVLGVTKEMLFASSHREKYKYDEHFTKEIHEQHQTFCDGLGLSHDFMKFLKTEIQDELFPVWSPISFFESAPFADDCEYKRMSLMDAFQCDSQNEYQRQTKDGQTVNLSYADYQFMKDVQDEVISYIEYLFFRRREEMKKEVERFNAEHIKRNNGLLSVAFASKKKLEEIDRYDKCRNAEYVQEVLKNAKNNKER